MRAKRCHFTGVRLDDGIPVHRARVRVVDGREVDVCLAIANVIDSGSPDWHLQRFAQAMREREEKLAAKDGGGRPWIPDEMS